VLLAAVVVLAPPAPLVVLEDPPAPLVVATPPVVAGVPLVVELPLVVAAPPAPPPSPWGVGPSPGDEQPTHTVPATIPIAVEKRFFT
jgi:hypothetical protein